MFYSVEDKNIFGYLKTFLYIFFYTGQYDEQIGGQVWEKGGKDNWVACSAAHVATSSE